MNQIEKLLNELRNLKEAPAPTYDPRVIWEGIAARKDFSEMGFKTKKEFEDWISDNPYANL